MFRENGVSDSVEILTVHAELGKDHDALRLRVVALSVASACRPVAEALLAVPGARPRIVAVPVVGVGPAAVSLEPPHAVVLGPHVPVVGPPELERKKE